MKVIVGVVAVCTPFSVDEQLAQFAHATTLLECPGIKDPPSTVTVVIITETMEKYSPLCLPQVDIFDTSRPERFLQLLP